MKEEVALGILEEKHVIDILFFLSRHGPSKKSDIYSEVSTNPRMPLKLNIMEKEGLIIQHINTINNNTTTVMLTDKGKMVIDLLTELSRLICGDSAIN